MTASRVATAAAPLASSPPAVRHAVFPRSGRLLLDVVIEWLSGLDDRFRGSEEFANGLLLFANGSSMLGFAADHMDVRFCPAGTFIVEQDEPAGELFLVLSGTVDVVREHVDGSPQRLATLGPGSFFGEEALATAAPRNAHVVAATGTTVFVLAPGPATLSAGGGTTSPLERFERADEAADLPPGAVTVDVRAQAMRKLAALAHHRSQYAVSQDMFRPRSSRPCSAGSTSSRRDRRRGATGPGRTPAGQPARHPSVATIAVAVAIASSIVPLPGGSRIHT